MSTTVKVTIEQYEAMTERGDFVPVEDHRVELIEGEIVPMSPIYPPHESALGAVTEWSYEALPGRRVTIRVQDSLRLPESNSMPQPDLCWVRRGRYQKRSPEAADVILLVEVAVSSLSRDRGRKSRLYARSGVADYWIVDVRGRRVEVRRDPEGETYRSIRVYLPGESISPLAFPEINLPVDLIFPADEEDEDDLQPEDPT